MMVAPARRRRPSRSFRPRTRRRTRWTGVRRVGTGAVPAPGSSQVEGPGAPAFASCSLVSVLLLFDHQVDDLGLADVEAGLGFENFAHFDAIELLVALGAGAPDGGAAGGVEQTELDADGIGDLAHDAAQGVDFADQVALGDAADGRIAAHLGDQVHIHGDEGGLEAHARRGHGGLAAGVSRAHDHHIVLFSESHPILFYGFTK